ncbi:manganese efflux pump [Butyrivibrio sp. FCS014]|uniref:manganese efflux pump n=1 Tax=Butyrivibrio sp. FCS014 TaxID=1408304 RepID=UPI000466F504|nr:manganese efflux pump [Butyrivibrio sp. FCS014]
MGLIELLLLSIGLAMDAFAVSICKGLSAGRLTKKEYLLCGVWFGTFQGMMPLIGYLVGSRFERFISIVAPWVAFILLSLIGGNMIKEALGPDEETPPGFDVKTMFMMAVATSIDALAVGITFVAVPVEVFEASRISNVIFAVIVIGVITFVISMIGVKIGSVFGDRYKSGSEIMGGTILIFIGLRSLITHLDSANTLSDTETIFGMLIPLIGTLLGSLIIYAKKDQVSDNMRAILAGCGFGVMFSVAVWGMIEPAVNGLTRNAQNGIIPVTISFCLGVILQILLDKLVPHTHVYSDITEGPESELKPEIKAILKEVVHHTPEGIALGAIYAAHFMETEWISSTVALVLAVAIALQNIPEALNVSLWLRETGTKTGKAFLMGVISGAPIPIFGIITVVLAVLFPNFLPYIMAVSGGALVYTTIEEIPQIALKKDNDRGALAFTIGFAIVMLMIFL